MKTCIKCSETKDMFSFHKKKGSADGYRNVCKVCRQGEHVERYSESKDVWNKRAVEWRKANPEVVKQIDKKYREANKEKRNQQCSEWKRENKGHVNYLNSTRYASKLQRTPSWLTEHDLLHIKCLYQVAAMRSRESGQEWQVDHIIPLNGETVSGLHVPSNLQVIPAIDNLRKSNTYGV